MILANLPRSYGGNNRILEFLYQDGTMVGGIMVPSAAIRLVEQLGGGPAASA